MPRTRVGQRGNPAFQHLQLLGNVGVSMWLGLVIAAVVSGVLGAIIVWIYYRFQLDHLWFVLITLAFAEMGAIVVEEWNFPRWCVGIDATEGHRKPAAFQFGGGQGAFWVMLGLAAICVLVNVAILN